MLVGKLVKKILVFVGLTYLNLVFGTRGGRGKGN